MSATTVTAGTPADLTDACALWFLADEGPASDMAVRRAAVKTLADQLLEVWQPPPAHLLLARAEDRLVGTVFGKSRRDDPSTGQISMLAVHPQWQRRGIGSRLVDAVLAALVDDGCVRCRMYVAASDDRVQRFYEKRGWTFSGRVEPSPDTAAPERVYLKEPLP